MIIIEKDRRDTNMSNPFREKLAAIDPKKAGRLAGKILGIFGLNPETATNTVNKVTNAGGALNKATEIINKFNPETIKQNLTDLASDVTGFGIDLAGEMTNKVIDTATDRLKGMGTRFLDRNKWRIGGGAAAAAGLYGGYKGLQYYLKRRAANMAHQRALQLAEAPSKNIVQQIKGLGGNLQNSADAINTQLQNISNSLNGRQFGRDLIVGAGEGLGQLGSQAYNMARNKLNQLGQGINNYRVNTINPFVAQHRNALIGAGSAAGAGLGGYGIYNLFNSDN